MKLYPIVIAVLFSSLAMATDSANIKKCSSSLSLSLNFDNQKQHFNLEEANRSDHSVCLIDNGGPQNSNYRIEILSQDKNAVLFSQQFYLSPWQYYDGEVDEKNHKKSEGKHGGAIKATGNSFKNIILPLPTESNKLRFRISRLKDQKILSEGAIK